MADKIVQGYDVYGGYVYPFTCIDGLVRDVSYDAASQPLTKHGADAIVDSIKGKDVSLGDLDCSVGVGIGDYFSVGNVGGTPTFNMGYADASIETISAVNINKSTLNISNSVNAHGSVTVDNGQNNSSTGASESLSWSNGELVFKQSKNGGSLTEYLKIDSSKGIIMKGGGSRDVSIGDVSMFYLKSNGVSVRSTNNVDVSFGNLFSVHSGYDVSVITKYYDDGTKTHGMQLQHNGGYAEIDLFRTKYNGTGYNVVDINGSNAIRLWSNGNTIGSNRDFDASLADSSISLDKYPAFEVYNNGANQVVGIQNATINFVNGRRVNEDADKERVGIHSFKGGNKLTLWSSVYNYSDASKKDSESEIFMTAYGSAIKGYDKLGTNGNAYISVKSARKWDSGDEDYYQCGYVTLHSSDNVCVDSPKFSVGYGNAKRLLVNSSGMTVYNPIYCGKSGMWKSAGSNSMLKFNSANSKIDAGTESVYAPLWYAVDHFNNPWSIGLYSDSNGETYNAFEIIRYDSSMSRSKVWEFKSNGNTSIPGKITANVNGFDGVKVGLPIGSVIMWSGCNSNGDEVPEGWHLCDGSQINDKQLIEKIDGTTLFKHSMGTVADGRTHTVYGGFMLGSSISNNMKAFSYSGETYNKMHIKMEYMYDYDAGGEAWTPVWVHIDESKRKTGSPSDSYAWVSDGNMYHSYIYLVQSKDNFDDMPATTYYMICSSQLRTISTLYPEYVVGYWEVTRKSADISNWRRYELIIGTNVEYSFGSVRWVGIDGDIPVYDVDVYRVGPYIDNIQMLRYPDFRRRFPFGTDWGANGYKGNGIRGGEMEHTLLISEIPSHHHEYRSHFGQPWAGSEVNLIKSDDAGSGCGSHTMPTGGGGAHNNMPPYEQITFIVKTS